MRFSRQSIKLWDRESGIQQSQRRPQFRKGERRRSIDALLPDSQKGLRIFEARTKQAKLSEASSLQ